ATVLGNAERVYSNEYVLLVTQTDYRYSYDASARLQTIIHRFDLSGVDTIYTASGAVPGSIHDQFSLDERDGIIRVSTTEQPSWGIGIGIGVATPTPPPLGESPAPVPAMSAGGAPGTATPTEPAPDQPATDATDRAGGGETDKVAAPAPEPMPLPPQTSTSVSRVLTLGTNGDSLEVLGQTDAFGATEQIFATRFIGDRGYVVTFRQTDPLFVIDLSDATDPHVVGELHIPGFSNYLFPLDDDHLFSIGRDATPEGFVQGLALQIFDVSNPAAPELAQRYVFADASDSPANVDHRAITFHPDRGVVAFPHTSWQTGESTLEVFQISSESGFVRLGGLGMTDELDLDQCIGRYFGYAAGPELDEVRAQVQNDPAWQRDILASCRYGHQFRRGLFRDDFVYGISNTGIYVSDITEMAAGAVSSLSLPTEVYDNSGGYMGGGVAPGRPTVDPALPAPPPAAGGSANAGSAGTGSAGTGAGGASSSDDAAEKAE
ncbi:MAG TPA: beta-propeller domain-containing protein, partial [Polyangiaceae bacterium]|nr:beta-propeller domain-containing protein [Polyangiaceae bacterium]